jgi:hypothetical protein
MTGRGGGKAGLTSPPMHKPLTIGEFSLSPSPRRGASYTVINGGALTPYTIEKHALWCLFLDGQALPIGHLRYIQYSHTSQHQGVPRRSCSSVGLGGVGFMAQPSPDLHRRGSR